MEQKNAAVVRQAVGYRRYKGLDAAAASLYFFVAVVREFFQPSSRLADETVSNLGGYAARRKGRQARLSETA